MTTTRPAAVIGVALGAILTAAAPGTGQDVTWTGSVGYSSGDYYFAETTHTVTALTGVRVGWDRLTLSGSIPVIYQSTPWISYTGVTPVPTGGPERGAVRDSLMRRRGNGGGPGSGGSASASAAWQMTSGSEGQIIVPDTATYDDVGVGDPTFGASVHVLQQGADAPLTLTVRGDVKAPVASVERGFGTGEWDAGAGVALFRSFDRAYGFVDAEYWVLGDMDGFELQDPVAYAAGVGYTFDRVGLVGMFSGYSRIVEDTDPPMQVSVGVNYLPGLRSGVNANLSFGVSESSPDVSVSAGWSLDL